MKFKYALALIGCSLAVSLQSDAAVVVSLSSTAPIEGIIKSNVLTTGDAANITSFWRATGTPIKKNIGQGFSTTGATTSYSLSAVTFNIFAFNPAVEGLAFNISIYESASVGAAPTPAALVSTQTGVLPMLKKDDFITFSLDDAITLTPNKIYNVMFSFAEMTSDSATVNSLEFKTMGLSNTSGGRRWIESDGVFSASASNGFIFYAHAEAIPEPGSVILLGFGVLALARVLKRRHAL